MKYRIGIPKALLYYEYAALWHAFFEEMDIEAVVSGETNKLVLDEGAAGVVDEACLPVKVYFGHVAKLARKNLDFLFVPRLVSVERKAYICPKLMGLPDMLNARTTNQIPLLKPTLNLVRNERGVESFLGEIAGSLGYSPNKVKKAWKLAQDAYSQENVRHSGKRYCSVTEGEERITIFIAAHPYLIHDSYLNLNIIEKLKKMGCRIIIPEDIPRDMQNFELCGMPKQLFWSFGKIQLGATKFIMRDSEVQGVIILSAFGCGIDSFIDNMVIRQLKNIGLPYLSIILDEHSGEAGLDTRIEAFLDMLRWRRRKDEDHISAYGTYLGCHEGSVGASRFGSGCPASYE